MSRTILLADDSVTIQKVVELTFMDQDWEVVAVSDGKAALAKLAELQPALLIADVHMPGADGYEVCRSSKEIYPGMPVLLLVGTFEPFDERQAAASGADGHLKKPFDSQDLLAQVESLAGRPAAATLAMATAGAERQVSELEPPSLTEDSVAPEAPAFDLPAAADSAADGADPFTLPSVDAATEPPSPPYAPDVEEVEAPSVVAEAEVPSAAAPSAEAEAAAAQPVSSHTAPIELFSERSAAAAEDSGQAAAAAESPAPAAAVAPSPGEAPAAGNGTLSDKDVDRVARRVAELVGEKLLREVAWEVVPDLAELIIKERIRELESQVE